MKKQDELGQRPITPLLLSLTLPATIGMTVNALYNIIDTIFVGKGVGPYAIGGLSVIFPVQLTMFALAILIGTGAASVISRSLGAGNQEHANRTASAAWVFGILAPLALASLLMPFIPPLLRFLGAGTFTYPHAREYLQVILWGFPIILTGVISHNIARAEGRPEIAMISLLIGALSNIILDALFIMVFQWGTAGAAWATLIARSFSILFLAAFFFVYRCSSIQFRIPSLQTAVAALRETVPLGMSNFTRQIATVVLVITINNVLQSRGDDMALSVYGIINRLMLFTLMPLFGLAHGFQPIAGYNWGAGKLSRVKQSLIVTLIMAFVYSSLLLTVILLCPYQIARLFSHNKELISQTRPVLQTVFIMFPAVSLQIIGSVYFMAVGRSGPAVVLTLSRQFLLLIPFVLLFPLVWGTWGVWAAFPAADGLSTIVTVFFLWFGTQNLRSGHNSASA